VGARIAANQVERGIRHVLKKCGGQAGRQGHAERIAVASRILHRDQAALACDRNVEHAARAHKSGCKCIEFCSAQTLL